MLETGGHLGASIGTVELCIALHRVFEESKDALVFDVGHQAYVHKLLTGRREAFQMLRKEDGVSGFLNRKESEHDWFGAGHASVDLSQPGYSRGQTCPWGTGPRRWRLLAMVP